MLHSFPLTQFVNVLPQLIPQSRELMLLVRGYITQSGLGGRMMGYVQR
jgi:hypothetical protein